MNFAESYARIRDAKKIQLEHSWNLDARSIRKRVDFWLISTTNLSILKHFFLLKPIRRKKKFAEKKMKQHSLEKSDASRQIDDRLSWVSTIRNEKIAQSFTTLGSIKVVYSSFEMIAQ